MRDTGRIECYRAEWDLGHQEQVAWDRLLALAKLVVSDPTVREAYPRLDSRNLTLRPVMAYRARYVGEYLPRKNSIRLAWGGRSNLVLMHELAHAATPHARQGHGPVWRNAYVWLTWRFLGEELGRRLAAAFANHHVLEGGSRDS